MGRGSSKIGGGSGGGVVNGLDNGYIEANLAFQNQIDAITDTIIPDPVYGRISAQITNKAGKDIDKLMEKDDQFIIKYNSSGNENVYTKYDNGWFTHNGSVYDTKDLGRNIAIAKYPNPHLGQSNVSFTIRKKITSQQQNAINDIANRVGKSGGMNVQMKADGSIDMLVMRGNAQSIINISKQGARTNVYQSVLGGIG